jgi:hypothetical protein
MVRRQIQLTDDQDAALRREAVEQGLSIAAVIRSLVEESLSERSAAKLGAATQVFGRYRSGRSDVGERHDAYLDEAFGG